MRVDAPWIASGRGIGVGNEENLRLRRGMNPMTGKGPRHERETVIVFNEEDSTASVWPASESVYRQLIKRGYCPAEDNERSGRFVMLKRDVKLPRPKSEKRSQIARRRSEGARTNPFQPAAPNRATVQPPNASQTCKDVEEGQ